MSAERLLVWFLRISAVMFLSAALAVVMPTAWMAAISKWYGIEFPDVPLMQYLARAMSAVYATMGASYWFMSCDVRRYLPLLRFTVPLTAVFTVATIALDLWIPMPPDWTVGEGVSLVVWTAALWWLVRRVENWRPCEGGGGGG